MTAGLLSFEVEARKPAVEPVMGLSIEEYDNVPPEKAQGFNFEQDSKQSPKQVKQNQITPNQNPVAPRSLVNQSLQSADSDTPAILFYILLSLLPFVVWFGLMKSLESNEEEFTAEMYDLEAQRRKREEAKDDDIPKAS